MRVEATYILSVLISCRGWYQSGTVHYCSDKETLYVANVVIKDATVNKVMSVNYSVEFTRRLVEQPRLEIVMSIADGPYVPCIDNIGSCVYHLCRPRNGLESLIGSPWGNDCPVPRGLFRGYFHYKLTATAWNVLQGRAVIIRANVLEGSDLFGCFRLSAIVRPAK